MLISWFCLKRFALFALGCLALVWLLIPIAAHSVITSVEVIPSEPTDQDTVRIEMEGYLPDGCWSFEGFECGDVAGKAISIELYGYDSWLPGVFCPENVVPYGFECHYAPLDPGIYTVTVTEHHESLRDPEPDVQVVEFEVWSATGTPPSGPAISELALLQNLPNPFNPTTKIRYSIPQDGLVMLTVYDATGQLVRSLVSEQQPAEYHEVHWLGDDNRGEPVPSGVYFYKLDLDGRVQVTRRMVVMR
jgi:hypothetical protein